MTIKRHLQRDCINHVKHAADVTGGGVKITNPWVFISLQWTI